MTTYDIRHRTRFDYGAQVKFARCNLRLKPIDWPGQRLEAYNLSAEPTGRLSPARAEAGRALLGVAGLFLLSLTFRTLDRAVCPVWPLGTHALWHILNAGVLYALIVIAARYRRRVP